MVAKRDEWMSVEDFLALDRENLDQKYENVILPLLSLSEDLENGIHHNPVLVAVLGFWPFS
jgi:hypothetical protein